MRNKNVIHTQTTMHHAFENAFYSSLKGTEKVIQKVADALNTNSGKLRIPGWSANLSPRTRQTLVNQGIL